MRLTMSAAARSNGERRDIALTTSLPRMLSQAQRDQQGP
jgi:hypothetical protein